MAQRYDNAGRNVTELPGLWSEDVGRTLTTLDNLDSLASGVVLFPDSKKA